MTWIPPLLHEEVKADLDHGDMRCEKHPERAWPHDDCGGPGCPGQSLEETLRSLAWQREWLRFYLKAIVSNRMKDDDDIEICWRGAKEALDYWPRPRE